MNISLQHKRDVVLRIVTPEELLAIAEGIKEKVTLKPKLILTEEEKYFAQIKNDLIFKSNGERRLYLSK